MHMKRIVAVLLTLCLVLAAPLALAADYPFKEGVNYHKRFTTGLALPTMLNFGYADLAYGEDLYRAEKTTVKKAPVQEVEAALDREDLLYVYAKWQYRERTRPFVIDAMLVITDPEGAFYATYGEWEQGSSRAGAVCSWFFDVTDCLKRCREENDGSLPKGEYTFSMFFNDRNFRVSRVTLT